MENRHRSITRSFLFKKILQKSLYSSFLYHWLTRLKAWCWNNTLGVVFREFLDSDMRQRVCWQGYSFIASLLSDSFKKVLRSNLN